jgi:glycolate oxidase iron-sulfur subunit
VRDVLEFLHENGLRGAPGRLPRTVAYHDPCHAIRAQRIRHQPRELLRQIPDLALVDVPDEAMCCGAAGQYNVTQPGTSSELRRLKVEALRSTGATTVASANPGCTTQLIAGLRERRVAIEVVHPIQLLDRAYARR